MKNRLKLDFSIPTSAKRKEFLDTYLEEETFKKTPLTEKELETLGNYLLWGKDDTNGKNAIQKKEVLDPSTRKTWKKSEPESLDGLLEETLLSEMSLRNLGNFIQNTTPKEIFSRAEARKKAPPIQLEVLEDLWERIDLTDLQLNLWEIQSGKRTDPPRQELLDRFTSEAIAQAEKSISDWTDRIYQNKRHYLVELRREQYTIRDTYCSPVRRRTFGTPLPPEPTDYLSLRPVGSILDNKPVFLRLSNLVPSRLTEEHRAFIPMLLAQDEEPATSIFNFEDSSHIYAYITSGVFIKEIELTLEYYIANSNLKKFHKRILDLKLKGVQNADIARTIEKEFDHRYTDNYISTIYTQKIIPSIADAATYHRELLEKILCAGAFKNCRVCGRELLISERNFSRRARSKDGFSNRCKVCDKENRSTK